MFEDLGHPRPAEALAKAELARKIAELIVKRRLTQAAAAELLNVDQPKVSALVRGRLAGFSLDRLVRFLVQLGSDVATARVIPNMNSRSSSTTNDSAPGLSGGAIGTGAGTRTMDFRTGRTFGTF